MWKLLESNDCRPFPFEEVHSNLSSKKRCTESKEDAQNLHESYIRDQILERLEPAAVNRSCVDGENINIVSDFLGTTHPQLLEIENNTRGQASCDKWYKERRI